MDTLYHVVHLIVNFCCVKLCLQLRYDYDTELQGGYDEEVTR